MQSEFQMCADALVVLLRNSPLGDVIYPTSDAVLQFARRKGELLKMFHRKMAPHHGRDHKVKVAGEEVNGVGNAVAGVKDVGEDSGDKVKDTCAEVKVSEDPKDIREHTKGGRYAENGAADVPMTTHGLNCNDQVMYGPCCLVCL